MSAVRFAQYSTILFGLYNISLTNGSQYDEFIQKFFFVFVRFDILFSRPPAGIKKPRRRRLRRGFLSTGRKNSGSVFVGIALILPSGSVCPSGSGRRACSCCASAPAWKSACPSPALPPVEPVPDGGRACCPRSASGDTHSWSDGRKEASRGAVNFTKLRFS